MPFLGDDGHKEVVEKLNIIAAKIVKRSAIMLISAHWQEASPSITSGVNPALIYDYYGFQKQAYGGWMGGLAILHLYTAS